MCRRAALVEERVWILRADERMWLYLEQQWTERD